MSVYAGDSVGPLRRALASTVDQTRPPAQIVIVRDGPVPTAIDTELDRFASETSTARGVTVDIVRLPDNRRLARALEAGLLHCEHEIVARADADDVSRPERFAVQVPVIEAGADIVGSAIAEFGSDDELPDGNGTIRSRPLTDPEIRRYAHFHSPFNHPSVVFRAAAVRAAGGYQDLDYMEDYWLFTRMIVMGARCANVPDALVMYRADRRMYKRRGSVTLASDWRFQLAAHRIGFMTTGQLVRNLALRTAYRLVPAGVRKVAYTALLTGRRVQVGAGS